MHTQCAHNAHIMHTECTHYAHNMHKQCTQYAHIMHTMHTECTHHARSTKVAVAAVGGNTVKDKHKPTPLKHINKTETGELEQPNNILMKTSRILQRTEKLREANPKTNSAC